jgi:hypothetical protein
MNRTVSQWPDRIRLSATVIPYVLPEQTELMSKAKALQALIRC